MMIARIKHASGSRQLADKRRVFATIDELEDWVRAVRDEVEGSQGVVVEAPKRIDGLWEILILDAPFEV